MVFHCLNRGNDRRELFFDDADYAAFERVLESALDVVPVWLLAYCLMPNHAPLSASKDGTCCCDRGRMGSSAGSCSG
jgi:putative transposase